MEHFIDMRRIYKLSVLCLTAGVVSACAPESVFESPDIPTAGVRFINAVPDTAAMDLRWVDIVENNPHWGVAFRNNVVISPTGVNGIPASTLIQYKPVKAGTRHFRIFMNGGCSETACNQAYASTVVKDTTVTLVAGKNYTALLMGYANPGRTGSPAGLPAGAPTMRLVFYEETVADPGAGNVALRVINTTASAIDVSYYADGSAAPGTPTWANVAPLSMSTFSTTGAGIKWFKVRNAGTAVDLFADRRALRGSPAVTVAPGPFEAIPGTEVPGSAVTAIVFPRSVAGTQAPQTTGSATVPSFATPAISFMWDRRPPPTSGT